jgi:CRP/FNR family cyclic AMP-dependent transcriptional regulator
VERLLNRINNAAPPIGVLFSGANLGGKVSRYREKQSIYSQGDCANSLFYIEEGGVRLTTLMTFEKSATTTILGVNDFLGELCLADYPFRISSAVALCDSSIRIVKRVTMLRMLRTNKNRMSHFLLARLLSSIKSYKDHIAELLTFGAERRLAQVLLHIAHLDENGPAVVEIPLVSHQILAEMVGTTRPRVNAFMNRFRKQGFVKYDKKLEIHKSLLKVLERVDNHE